MFYIFKKLLLSKVYLIVFFKAEQCVVNSILITKKIVGIKQGGTQKESNNARNLPYL